MDSFAQAFDDVGRSLRHEGLVTELTVGGLQALLVLGKVFGQALALGRDVDLAGVDHLHIEGWRGARALAAERRGGELDGADAAELGQHIGVALGQGRGGLACVGRREDADGRGLLLRNTDLLAQAAHSDDELLQGLDGVDRLLVGREVGGLREAAERDGLGRRRAVVERVPDLPR